MSKPINNAAEIGKFKNAVKTVEKYLDFIDQSQQRNAEIAILTLQPASQKPASENAVKMFMQACNIKGTLRPWPVNGNWVYCIGLDLQ